MNRVIHPGYGRLGRHYEPPPLKAKLAAAMRWATRRARPVRSVQWERHGGPFDQGELGSCTANAALGCLMTGPFYKPGRDFVEADCVRIYSAATRLDTVPGHFPPSDTGSSGPAALNACQRENLISGFHHVFSFTGVLQALQSGPGITGTNWHEGMDSPSGPDAIVAPTGAVRGGHEYECYGLSVEKSLLFFWNSWGTGYGNGGRFSMTFASYQQLLAERGDFTVPVA